MREPISTVDADSSPDSGIADALGMFEATRIALRRQFEEVLGFVVLDVTAANG